MGALDPRTPVDDLDRIAVELNEVKRRLDLLEAPSGTQAYRAVPKLQALVVTLQAQVDAAIAANSYTASTIDAKVANPPAGSNVTGDLKASGTTTLSGPLYVPNAYATDLTGTRRTGWWQSDGRAGYASSAREKKTAIRDADGGPLVRAVRKLRAVRFRYRAEVAKRTQLRIDGIDLDYRPAEELGLIADEVDAAGLGELVYRDKTGVLEGVEYVMLVMPLLASVQYLLAERDTMRAEIDSLKAAIFPVAK